MSPSLGAINQNLLMISDFFIVPTSADFFSLMAIDSLSRVLPKWYYWAKRASELPILKEANYPFPDINLKFLGIIIQNYRVYGGRETAGFQKWIQNIEEDVSDNFVPILQQNNMMLPETFYTDIGMNHRYCLTQIANFNSLIAVSQKYRIPIYDLTDEQLRKGAKQGGNALKTSQEKQKKFKKTFSELADKVINLTSAYAVSN